MLGPIHKQVEFTTTDGRAVFVDEGLHYFLSQLAQAGVRTQYSCQGEEFAAYVVADRKSFRPLLRKIRKNYKKGRYSDYHMETVRLFLDGHREYAFVLFARKSFDMRKKFIWTNRLSDSEEYALEWSFDNVYGFRFTARWSKTETERIVSLLSETNTISSIF